jgi:hypothetical protein
MVPVVAVPSDMIFSVRERRAWRDASDCAGVMPLSACPLTPGCANAS